LGTPLDQGMMDRCVSDPRFRLLLKIRPSKDGARLRSLFRDGGPVPRRESDERFEFATVSCAKSRVAPNRRPCSIRCRWCSPLAPVRSSRSAVVSPPSPRHWSR
jgi:hypothetical protein